MGNEVTDWPPARGAIHGLTSGGPILAADCIRFDATVAPINAQHIDFAVGVIPQPLTIAIVAEFEETDSFSDNYWDSTNAGGTGNRCVLFNDARDFKVFAGAVAVASPPVNTELDGQHLVGVVYDGASSFLRKDFASSATFNPGGQSLDGFRLGANNALNNVGDFCVRALFITPQAVTAAEFDDLINNFLVPTGLLL